MVSIIRPLYLLFLVLLAPLGFVFFRKSGIRGPRKIAAFSLHTAVIVLLAFSLSGVTVGSTGRRVNVLFVLDGSDSLDDLARGQAMDSIDRVLAEMQENDTAGLVVFGANASVEIPPSHRLEVLRIESAVDGKATDISNALRVALAAFPAEGTNRIVLLSDGNENRGKASDVAGIARSLGVEIHTVPLSPVFSASEIAVRDIVAPSEVRAGQIHEFNVLIHSTGASQANLSLYRDGRVVGDQEIDLSPGDNRLSYNGVFAAKGLHRYEVVIASAFDTIADNNRWETFVRVIGAPSILYISQEEAESEALLRALTVQGIRITRGTSLDIPSRLSDLIAFDAIILDNVPGFDISLARMELLERYVRDAGGGLLMIGGGRSYGVGGYYKTPVERALPVDVDAPLPVSIPSLSLIMLLDKSGSMASTTEGGGTKLDLVKEAAYSAIELLNPLHRVGLLAFDADIEWVVRPIEAGERDRIAANLFRMSTGGGTDLYKAYDEGVETLGDGPAAIKHIIILSDGLTQTGDFASLTAEAVEQGISVSTVAVGEDADRELMADIAERGNGRAYYTDDIRNVPRIFASETMIVSYGLISEQTFFPRYTAESEIMKGIDPAELPPLEGFVRTYLKEGALQVLSAVDGNPLLAVWRYGLGRTAAFTSDLGSRWGGEWIDWLAFPRFASQLIRWTQRGESAELLRADIRHEEGTGTITVDAVNAEGEFENHLRLSAAVAFPDGGTTEITLTQTAPGRYGAEFPADQTGHYFLTFFGGRDDLVIPPEPFGTVVPYPAEYGDLEPNLDLLGLLASRTNGMLSDFSAQQDRRAVFQRAEEKIETDRDVWPFLALAALLLFVFEIAVRRVRLPQSWRDRLTRLLRRRGGPPRSYGDWEEMIEEGLRMRAEERRREGIIPLFKREREARSRSVYIAGLRRRSERGGKSGGSSG